MRRGLFNDKIRLFSHYTKTSRIIPEGKRANLIKTKQGTKEESERVFVYN